MFMLAETEDVGVLVTVPTTVGVRVGVAELVRVGVAEPVGVAVRVVVGELVAVGEGVGVSDPESVAVGVNLNVAVGDGEGVDVLVGVFVARTVPTMTDAPVDVNDVISLPPASSARRLASEMSA
jgi:hypothetical protein